MTYQNILVWFDDGSAMVYELESSVRIANRGPSSVPMKDYEQVRQYLPEWVGFGNFKARILALGHRVQTHRGLVAVLGVERDLDLPPGDPSVVGR